MPAQDLTIGVGKYDFVWAVLSRSDKTPDPDNPVLAVMVHSFPGDSKSFGNIFGSLSEKLDRNGFHTLRFDMRGCGNSNRGAQFFTLKTAYEDCIAVLRWAEKTGYRKIFIIAEGLGAGIAVTALTEAIKPAICGAVFLWPIFDPRRSWLADLIPLAALAEKNGVDHVATEHADIGVGFLKELQAYNMIPLLGRVSMPAMIHHGLADTKSPPVQMELLRQAAGTEMLEFITYDSGEHGLKDPGHRDKLLRETRDFLKKTR